MPGSRPVPRCHGGGKALSLLKEVGSTSHTVGKAPDTGGSSGDGSKEAW